MDDDAALVDFDDRVGSFAGGLNHPLDRDEVNTACGSVSSIMIVPVHIDNNQKIAAPSVTCLLEGMSLFSDTGVGIMRFTMAKWTSKEL